tara:strand:+ start:6950 stop:7216 length:267 start_codon:yes stop_codon:yes gene_type:complete
MTRKNTIPPTPKLKTSPSKTISSREPLTKEDLVGGTFEESLQKILEKFKFPEETRREIFSQLTNFTTTSPRSEAEQQAGNPQKGTQND